MDKTRSATVRSVEVPDLVVEHVSKSFTSRGRRQRTVEAVRDVSFVIPSGGAVGLVGASGSGKSTIGNMITGTEKPDKGSIRFGDINIERLSRRAMRDLYQRVQLIFQDAYAALNPVHTIGYMVSRPCINYLGMSVQEADDRVYELLERVGLTPASQFYTKLPHQLSGGQRQRVVIARALAGKPQLLIADEPVSMLDVSLRAGILRLLAEIQAEQGLSLLYITHDLLSARVLSQRIMVLHHGEIVEEGATLDVLQHPKDPYTIELLNAVTLPTQATDSAITDV